MFTRMAVIATASMALVAGMIAPTPAEAQFRRGGGIIAGVLAGALAGAIIAGSARRATAAPRVYRAPRAAARPSSSRQAGSSGQRINANATAQNAGGAAAVAKDPFAKPSQSVSGSTSSGQ